MRLRAPKSTTPDARAACLPRENPLSAAAPPPRERSLGAFPSRSSPPSSSPAKSKILGRTNRARTATDVSSTASICNDSVAEYSAAADAPPPDASEPPPAVSFLDPLLPAACFRFFDPGACASSPSGSGIPVTANHAARWRRSSATSSRVSIRTEDTADPVVLDLRAAGGPNASAPPADSDTSAPPPPNRIRVKNREKGARDPDPSAGGAPSVGSARSNPTASPKAAPRSRAARECARGRRRG